MSRLSPKEQAKIDRRKALPVLAGAALAFLASVHFLGFGFFSTISLVLLAMVGWYIATVEGNLSADEAFAAARRRESAARRRPQAAGAPLSAEAGSWVLDEDDEAWSTRLQGCDLEVRIAAEWNAANEAPPPSEALLASVAELVSDFGRFEERMRLFLEGEAQRPGLIRFHEEIARLQAEQVAFLFPAYPDRAVIHFEQLAADRWWMCRYEGGQAVQGSLRFDT